MLTIAFIHLLEKYVQHIRSRAAYIKLTLCFEMILPNSYSFSYTLSQAIPLLDSKNDVIDLRAVYEKIAELVRGEAEKYQDSAVMSVKIRFYFNPKSIQLFEESSQKMLDSEIQLVMKKVWDNCLEPGKLPDPKSLATQKSRFPKYMTTIKNGSNLCRPFLVADIETLIIGDVHVPYAAGYLVVKPGDDLSSIPPHSLNVYFSEDKSNPKGKGVQKCCVTLYQILKSQ